MNQPPSNWQRLTFTTDAGAPVVVHISYGGQKYVCRLNLAVLGAFLAPGPGPNGMPNFMVQSGNVMSIEKDTGS